MPVNVTQVGPGELTIGESTSLKSLATTCVGAQVIPNVEKGDPRKVLSGDVIPGARTESATLEVKLLDDFGQQESVSEWLWEHRGQQMPVSYIPKSALSRRIRGTITVEPINLGGDVDTVPEQTVTFDFVGMPTIESVTTGTQTLSAPQTLSDEA